MNDSVELTDSMRKLRREHRIRTALESIVRELLFELAPDRRSTRKKGKRYIKKK